MKKKILALGLVMAVAMSACGKQSEGTSASGSPTPTEAAEESNTEELEQETEDTSQKTVEGTIKSYTGSYLSLMTEDGRTLELDVTEAELDCPLGILSGEQIRVDYQGDLEERNGKILKVSNVQSQKKAKKAVMTGTVEEISNNTLTILTEDSGSVTFTTIGAAFDCDGGLGIGTPVEVTYRGEVRNGSARNVKVLSVTDWEKEEEDSQEDQEETFGEELTPTPTEISEDGENPKELLADILTVEGETMTVTAGEEGQEENYELSLADARIQLKYGLLEGSEVRIIYQGELDGDSSTVEIADVDPDIVNEETGGFTVVGTVMFWGPHAMTIMSNDGVQITCTTADTELGMEEHPQETDYIKIIIKPGKKSNIYQALSVERV